MYGGVVTAAAAATAAPTLHWGLEKSIDLPFGVVYIVYVGLQPLAKAVDLSGLKIWRLLLLQDKWATLAATADR